MKTYKITTTETIYRTYTTLIKAETLEEAQEKADLALEAGELISDSYTEDSNKTEIDSVEEIIEGSVPKLRIQLSGKDGNVFSIIGRCLEVMSQNNYSKEEQDNFTKDITSTESYEAALAKISEYFIVS